MTKDAMLKIIEKHNDVVNHLKKASDVTIPASVWFRVMEIPCKRASLGLTITRAARNMGIDAVCSMQDGEITVHGENSDVRPECDKPIATMVRIIEDFNNVIDCAKGLRDINQHGEVIEWLMPKEKLLKLGLAIAQEAIELGFNVKCNIVTANIQCEEKRRK